MKNDILVCGNSIASLVAVDSLSRRGKRVTWVMTSPKIGGVFAGVVLEGESYDIGMTNFEFDLESNRPTNNILDYSIFQRNDCANHVQSVISYVGEYSECAPLAKAQMLFEGQLFEDFVMSNSLEVLGSTLFPKGVLLDSLHPLADPRYHPKNKFTSGSEFSRVPYVKISLENHVKIIHERLIEPWLRKLNLDNFTNIPGHLHRSAWGPLYYPETLTDFLTKGTCNLKNTVFSYPKSGTFGTVLSQIQKQVSVRPEVTILGAEQLQVDVATRTVGLLGRSGKFNRIVWGEDINKLLDLLHFPVRYEKLKTSMELIYFRTLSENLKSSFSVITSPDPAVPWYRVTRHQNVASVNQSSTVFCTEVGGGVGGAPSVPKNQLMHSFGSFLERPEQIDILARIPIKQALPCADFQDESTFDSIKSMVNEQFPQFRLIGPASGPYTSTFNDQVIQGMLEAEYV